MAKAVLGYDWLKKSVVSGLLHRLPRPLRLGLRNLGMQASALYYRGNRVACPVCGSHYREFLNYGVTARPNALCMKCMSLERHRLIWLYLQKRTDFFTASHRVLHVAPEFCFLPRFEALPNLDYVTADLMSPLAKVKMNIEQIPFPDNHFSVILCSHVLEHVSDAKLAMRELCRVLQPGGWAILQVPVDLNRAETYEDPTITDPAERLKHFGQTDHVRQFGRDYPQRLAAAGFTVEEDRFAAALPAERVQRYALSADEIIYRCSKKA